MSTRKTFPLKIFWDEFYFNSDFEDRLRRICLPFDIAPPGEVIGISLSAVQQEDFMLAPKVSFLVKCEQDLSYIYMGRDWTHLPASTRSRIAEPMMDILQTLPAGLFSKWVDPHYQGAEGSEAFDFMIFPDVTLVAGADLGPCLDDRDCATKDATQDMIDFCYSLRARKVETAHEHLARSARLRSQVEMICADLDAVGEIFIPTPPDLTQR